MRNTDTTEAATSETSLLLQGSAAAVPQLLLMQMQPISSKKHYFRKQFLLHNEQTICNQNSSTVSWYCFQKHFVSLNNFLRARFPSERVALSQRGFQMPDGLTLSYILIMLMEPRLLFLCWLATESWTVPFFFFFAQQSVFQTKC